MTDEQPGGPGSTAAPPHAPGPGRRITRSRRHKVVGGVCGGLGRYFDLDPIMFRVPLAVLSLIGGVGLFAYGVAWLVMPFEDEEENEGRRMLSGRVDGPGLTALVTVVVGCGLMLASLPGSTSFFSVMLLGMLVAAAYWSRYRRTGGPTGMTGLGADLATAQAVASAPPEVQAPPAPGAPSWWREPGAGGAEEPYLWGPPNAGQTAATPVAGHGADTPAEGADGPPDGPVSGSEGRPAKGAAASERPFWLGGPVLLGTVLVGAVVMLAAWNSTPLGTVLVYGLAAALAVAALGLVVGAFWGRIGTGTIVHAVLIGVILLGAAALPDTIPTERRDERWAPREVADVEPRYEVGTGVGRLDLAGLDLEAEERLRVEAEAGAGQFRVVIPHDALVEVTTDVWLGGYAYDEPRGESSGPSVTGAGFRTEWTGSFGPPPGRDASGVVELDLTMGVGHVVVERAPMPESEEDGAAESGDATEGDGALAAARPFWEGAGAAAETVSPASWVGGPYEAREEVSAP